MSRRARALAVLRRMLAASALLLGLPAGQAWAGDPVDLLPSAPLEESELGGGARLLTWRIEDRGEAAPALDLVVVEIPGGAAAWRVVPVDASGPRRTLLEGLACSGEVARISGGFFVRKEEGGYAPLGLAVGDGSALSPFSPRRWGGVLARRGPDSTILALAELPPDGAWDQALQSSPIVVAGGANDMLRDDGEADNRVAVGLDGRGGLVAVGAFRAGGGAVSLHTLAELILALGPQAGIAVEHALALDGGSSAQILLPASGRSWGSTLPGYMPNALCLGAVPS